MPDAGKVTQLIERAAVGRLQRWIAPANGRTVASATARRQRGSAAGGSRSFGLIGNPQFASTSVTGQGVDWADVDGLRFVVGEVEPMARGIAGLGIRTIEVAAEPRAGTGNLGAGGRRAAGPGLAVPHRAPLSEHPRRGQSRLSL